MANGSDWDRDIFSIITHTDRVKRLANAMSFMMTVPETSFVHFVDNVPWSSVNQHGLQISKCPKVVVDVGGSHGDLGEALLRKYPGIEKATLGIVEDLPSITQTNLDRGDPDEVSQRTQYQANDFFTEQVIKDADVYIFSNVLHDWSDVYAIQKLRNQIPALKPGARILVNNKCIEDGLKRNSLIYRAQWYVSQFNV